MKDFEKIHKSNQARYAKDVAGLYRKAVDEVTKLMVQIPDASVPFNFNDYPRIKKRIDAILKKLHDELQMSIENGIRAEYQLADGWVSEKVQNVFDKGNGAKVLSATEKVEFFRQFATTGAADKFLTRTVKGLNLSDRVWNLTDQFKTDMEIALEQGISKGLSAAEMSRNVRKALNDPNRLFRRVKQEDGTYKLSEAAKNYHPGQGVYRSSYKNALRLTGTETNIAYRSAFHERIQEPNWITGIEIRLSNNHTCKCAKGGGYIPNWTDICDELKGVYPKDFKFVGWHPNCRCEQIVITQDPIEAIREFKEGITTAKQIENLPPQFESWMSNNSEKLENAKSLPYFVRDNEKLLNK